MIAIEEIFGSMVFNDHVMRERLPDETYNVLKKTISVGKPIDKSVRHTFLFCKFYILFVFAN